LVLVSTSKAKESAVPLWQLQNFAKIIFEIFLSPKQGERYRSVMNANLRWPPFAKFCKNEFRLFLSLQKGERKCSVMMANSRWIEMEPLFAKFSKKKNLSIFFQASGMTKESAMS